jgi:hypothetical protein
MRQRRDAAAPSRPAALRPTGAADKAIVDENAARAAIAEVTTD